MVNEAIIRGRVRDLVLAVSNGDVALMWEAWGRTFNQSPAAECSRGQWDQAQEIIASAQFLMEVLAAGLWVANDNRWPTDHELKRFFRWRLTSVSRAYIRAASAIVANMTPADLPKFRRIAMLDARIGCLLPEVVARPRRQPEREPAGLVYGAMALAASQFLPRERAGVGPAFDRLAALLDHPEVGPELKRAGEMAYFRMCGAFTRPRVTQAQLQSLSDYLSAFANNSMAQIDLALRSLRLSAGADHAADIKRAWVSGIMFLYATPTAVAPTRQQLKELIIEERQHWATPADDTVLFTDDDAADALEYLSALSGLLITSRPTPSAAVTLSHLTALRLVLRADGRAMERLERVTWLRFEMDPVDHESAASD